MEMISIDKEVLVNLEERVRKLAVEKSYLQLMANLMNRLSSASGLENTIENMLGIVMDNIGGSNITIYYIIDNEYHSADVFGNKMKVRSIDDPNVQKVFETLEPIEFSLDFSNTRMTTPEFANAITWIFPLLVGTEIVGVFKIEDIVISKREVQQHLQIFFNYSALILKNEILGYSRLQSAYALLQASHDKLRHSEESYKNLSLQLESILDHIPSLVFYKDKNNNFIRVNQYVAQAYRKEKKELEGKSLSELFPQEVAEKYYQDDLDVINSRNAKLNIEETWETPEGMRWVNTSKIPCVDNNGSIIGVIGVSTDITERKKAEAEIKLKNETLLKLLAEKDKFFSVIAHDLRSPFNSFLGFTRMMAEDLHSLTLDQIQKIAVTMQKSATNLYDLLENLLEWSQLERGISRFDPSELVLRPTISKSLQTLSELARQKEISIHLDIPENLQVRADRKMLGSVIRNLTYNAIKFTSEGGQITIKAISPNDGPVKISVTDTGIGMSQEMISNLFKLDQSTNRRGTENEPTTGLGLIICKEFVEKHGGKLWVESEEGKGSTFNFTLMNK